MSKKKTHLGMPVIAQIGDYTIVDSKPTSRYNGMIVVYHYAVDLKWAEYDPDRRGSGMGTRAFAVRAMTAWARRELRVRDREGRVGAMVTDPYDSFARKIRRFAGRLRAAARSM